MIYPSVNYFLDLTVYLEEDNTIHFKGYTKPTDAKRYLNTKSFHPRSVFTSIPYSQMIRTIENNSKDDTRTTQLKELMDHFENSGYKKTELEELQQKAITKMNTPTEETTNDETNEDKRTLVFLMYSFAGIKEFKEQIRSLDEDFKHLIGDTKVMIATKKGSTIGNSLVQNNCAANQSKGTTIKRPEVVDNARWSTQKTNTQ